MRKLGEVLFVVGSGYLGAASGGFLLYPPWDVLAAVACAAAGVHLAGFRRYRWWPHSPARDASHELVVELNEHGRPKS